VSDENEARETSKRLSPGGTPGGLGIFLFGLALSIAGGYLIMNQVQVTSGYWTWWGTNTFGLTLFPLIIGIGLLFFNGKSIPGWVLAAGGAVVIFVGIIANLQIYVRQTSLYNLIIMLVLFAGGLGLMARSLKSQ
jgi:multisubunit Na+/H+ antiporter MnhF subunit